MKAAADPLINPVDLGANLSPADWLVLGPVEQARVTVMAFSSKEATLARVPQFKKYFC